MKTGDKIMWEELEWTCTGESKSVGRPFECNGCENETMTVTLFEATDPTGFKWIGRWCADCVDQAKIEQMR